MKTLERGHRRRPSGADHILSTHHPRSIVMFGHKILKKSEGHLYE